MDEALTSSESFDVIVVGGGPAGVTAALRAAELGARVALVERGRLGGTCTNDGCVPTRALAKAARLIRDADQFDEYGLTGEPPRVDLPRLLARVQEIVYTIHQKKQLLQHLQASRVAAFTEVGEARFVDAHTLALGDRHLRADKFILCAGGRARRLPFPGAEHALTHSDVWALKTLPESVAVVGAAATGCQLASIFADFGARVVLLDVAPRILPAEDEHVSQAVAAAFARKGIQIETGTGGLSRIERDGRGLELVFRRDEAEQRLSISAVILAVGWPGNVEALNLPAAGIAPDRGFIPVNDHLQTSAAHIFAAGDITGRMMLVQSAGHEARIAAENAVLGPRLTYGHYIVPHGGFTDPEYGSVGLTEAQAPDAAVAVVPYADLDRAVIDGRMAGFCKLIAARDTRLILGAHVVGEQAVEIVQLVAAAMAASSRVEQLAELELAYPTYTAIVGLAARRLTRALGAAAPAPDWPALQRVSAAEWERSQAP